MDSQLNHDRIQLIKDFAFNAGTYDNLTYFLDRIEYARKRRDEIYRLFPSRDDLLNMAVVEVPEGYYQGNGVEMILNVIDGHCGF